MLVLLFIVAALADTTGTSTESGMGWAQVGTALGLIIASAMGSGGAVLGARRFGQGPNPPQNQSSTAQEVPEGFWQRMDERTASIQKDQGVMRKRLHRHGNALLILISREGHTTEEKDALEALQDDSDED